jgi:hypothetical protein
VVRGVDRFPATIAVVIAGLAAAGGEVDPVRHLIVTATGSREGLHLSQHPAKHERWQDDLQAQREGHARRRLLVDQPLQIAEGYFEQNNLNAYTLNNLMATKNADGSAAVQFGGCDGNIRNCLPAMPSWNYLVRLYRQRAEILNGMEILGGAAHRGRLASAAVTASPGIRLISG